MRYPNLLIFKRGTIDTVTTISISLVSVATLDELIVHELVEKVTSEAAETTCILHFTCAEGSEVFSSLGDMFSE